jgi:arylsulfatase A-like enzyme
MATCVELGGGTYPTKAGENTITPMEGTNLTPAFADKPLKRELLAWEHEKNRAIRVGDMKLVSKAGVEWELYDLKADPVELTNLAVKRPDTVKELAAKWDAWAKRCQVLPYPEDRK